MSEENRKYIEVTPISIPTPLDVWNTAASARISYSDETDDFMALFSDFESYDDVVAFLKKLIGKGHTSVLEHLVFRFMVSGSRVYTHEQVRHRIASYTQKSLRKALENEHELDRLSIVVPKQIKSEDLDMWFKQAENTFMDYQYWLDKGYSVDVARYKLTQEWRTPIVMTINARSLRNYFSLRTSDDAHFEIRDVSERMLDIIDSNGLIFLFEDVL